MCFFSRFTVTFGLTFPSALRIYSFFFSSHVPEFIYSGAPEYWLDFANVVDRTWAAHQLQDSSLEKSALKHLSTLVNAENVVSILSLSHELGDKELRTQCVDYIVANAHQVQVFQTMELHKDRPFADITALSGSLTNEVQEKVMNRGSRFPRPLLYSHFLT